MAKKGQDSSKKKAKKPTGSKSNIKKGSKSKSSKKTQTKKRFSSTNYHHVRSLLWKRYKDYYDSYQEFIKNDVDENGKPIRGTSLVSQVYNNCKTKMHKIRSNRSL